MWRADRNKSENHYTIVIANFSPTSDVARHPSLSPERKLVEKLIAERRADLEDPRYVPTRKELVDLMNAKTGVCSRKATRAIEDALHALRRGGEKCPEPT
jgi:hypothetical protein